MKNHYVSRKLIFFLSGIISTTWFLIRVIPKPSRAGYPCMKVAAPLMSGFVVYLLALGGITVALRKAKHNIYQARYFASGLFLFAAIAGLAIAIIQGSQNTYAFDSSVTGPDDSPNNPMGKGTGINPGRVIWAWDREATNENCTNNFESKDWFFKPENTRQKVVSRMLTESLEKLAGKKTISESWDALFRYQNNKKYHENKGYAEGEKIFIKINQTIARGILGPEEINNGYYYPTSIKSGEQWKIGSCGAVETSPGIVLEILRQLVNVMGIKQSNIAIGDPQNHIYGHNFSVWSAEFPNVLYIDKFSTINGRTLIKPTAKDLIYYSDKTQNDKLFDIIENADYLINIANLKPHSIAGISLTAKNHFGSQSRDGASHLHYSLIAPLVKGKPTNTGYRKYRVLVDLMGSKYLGQNTILFVVDGIFGGGASELKGPVKYFMAPFNNDWSSSLFISQDQVALESVCYDFLRTEWNGINKHSSNNNDCEACPNFNGVDDYLHQAADRINWPNGISYDPDNTGTPLSSLGVHEHWNNAINKQYSRNLGLDRGIELVSVPDTLVKTKVSENNINITNHSFGKLVAADTFCSVLVDDDNKKWFLTENGIVSFDGKNWSIHNKNRKVPIKNLEDFKYDFSAYGPELWIASPAGATVASLPVDARSGATTYHTENTSILSDKVFSIAIGKKSMRWFGTEKGISAFRNKKWLTCSYQRKYPEDLFREFSITCMATSPDGDSLYAGTKGAGVVRVFRNNVDAISGASEYAQWGPIIMPSDTINSIFITSDGTQWFGTTLGVARHKGYNTLEGWTVFNTNDGLVHNFVQAIAADPKGELWFGTKGGVSFFDGTGWTSFTKKNGLSSNNILSIAVDKEGIVWFGTDNGVTSFNNGKFINYQ